MTDRLAQSIKVLGFLILLIVVLVYAKPFLVPLAFAGIFAMLLLPFSQKLEKKGVQRGWAIFWATMILVLIIAIVIGAIVWQVSEISKNADGIEQQLQQKLAQARQWIHSQFGVTPQKQDQMIKQSGGGGGGGATSMVTGFLSGLGGFLTDTILVIVYVFLFLYLRLHLRKFVLMLVPAANRGNAQTIMEEAEGVAQKYISGLAWMILCLWVMYSIGFTLVGVKSAILFAILCGLLEIVPFVGNLTGTAITAVAVLMQGGSTNMLLGVIGVYLTVQFIQTYLLEPLVVGKGVAINPLFTIGGIVGMELIWGIPGMILAIPLLGITKIICDHVGPLKPYGYLIGEEEGNEGGLMKKIKGLFKKGKS